MSRPPLLIAILAGLAACETSTGYLEVQAATTACPKDVQTYDLFLLDSNCDLEITYVFANQGLRERVTDFEGRALEVCAYPVNVRDSNPFGDCIVGRPYRDASGAAALASMSGSSTDSRAAAWSRAAAGEHASVAAFAKLALQLLAHGAPLELLGAVQAAGLDEVRHAEVCLAEARRLGADVTLGAFPFPGPVDAGVSLAALAFEAVREGCLSETLAAHVAGVAADLAPDPAVAAVLRGIADDEARHAVLSWRIVAWAQRVGGPEVKAAVRAAFAAPCPRIDVGELALRAGVDVDVLELAAAQAAATILTPAARALAA